MLGAAAGEKFFKCFENDDAIKQERAVFEIVEVVGKLFARCLHLHLMMRVVVVVELSPAGEPGFDEVADAVVGNLFFVECNSCGEFRPRPDERKLPPHYIPQLR